jgi:cysteinyl-tRNA synthetase
MDQNLQIFNSLSRKKEDFKPINPPFVGMYLCGPTVYGDAHLGHARPAIMFDVLFRYLRHLGYKVRYVRNITDVGHLENDLDEGEDKIAKKAKLEQIEPMEVVQYYTDNYHRDMKSLNVLSPSIEPSASGHIIEQIKMIEAIIQHGMAYEVEGSVYFDVLAYDAKYKGQERYGILSGRIIEDLLNTTRELDGQEEKRNTLDFALWKKAKPEHIMRWPSPWGDGFPGWHIECSAMSGKYLGEKFDIHGGGMDLLFPHHEGEIAQSRAANGVNPAKYWMHCNMITLDGKKMGKSLGNAISLEQFFKGDHPILEQAYTPITIRFFILQAHYRSTVDFSNEALIAAEKGFNRLMSAYEILNKIEAGTESTINLHPWIQNAYDAINDDFNTAILISYLFEACSWIHGLNEKRLSLNPTDLDTFKKYMMVFTEDILGLKNEKSANSSEEGLMDLILNLRMKVRANKDFATSDEIRDRLLELGYAIKDGKEGTGWGRI